MLTVLVSGAVWRTEEDCAVDLTQQSNLARHAS